MEQNYVYYFAYGSNMNPARMKERVVEFSEMFGVIMKDWQLFFNKKAKGKEGVGWASIETSKFSTVEGIIYKITKVSIEKLDRYEGYPHEYERQNLLVESDVGEILECVVYTANPTKVKDGLKPTKEYLEHLLEGKKYLSKDYVSFLRKLEII